MTNEQSHNDVEVLARLAGIRLPPERLAALSLGLAATERITQALSKFEFEETQPACRFRPQPLR